MAVPGLDALLREAGRVPAPIGRMMKRGRSRSLDRACGLAELIFGRPVAPAALTRLLDCPQDWRGCWLRADPVALTPDLGAVWLQPGVGLDRQSAAADDLKQLFADAGLQLDFPASRRGYVRLEHMPDCTFVAPRDLPGRSLEQVLPHGPGADRWRHLLNESQILLRHHLGTRPGVAGSLWFWGAGELPDRVPEPRICRLAGSSALLEAAAVWSGLPLERGSIEHSPQPGTLIEWAVDGEQDARLDLEPLSAWLTGAWRRLRLDRRLRRIELAGEGRVWAVTTRHAWGWPT